MSEVSSFSSDPQDDNTRPMEVPHPLEFEVGDEVTVQYGLPTDISGCRPEVPSKIVDIKQLTVGGRVYLVQPLNEPNQLGKASVTSEAMRGRVDGQMFCSSLVIFGDDEAADVEHEHEARHLLGF